MERDKGYEVFESCEEEGETTKRGKSEYIYEKRR
jgi:hypothetical protein